MEEAAVARERVEAATKALMEAKADVARHLKRADELRNQAEAEFQLIKEEHQLGKIVNFCF